MIIPPNSNTDHSYKKCAGHTYFDMVRSHYSTKPETSLRLAVENKQRLYDKWHLTTSSHLKYMRNIFKIPEFDQKVKVPGRKFLQYIFAINIQQDEKEAEKSLHS